MLPIRQAKSDEQVAEERRLLYVGITRARTHLCHLVVQEAIALHRRDPARTPSARSRPPAVPGPACDRRPSSPLLEALHLWRRERAKQDAVPAYVVAHDSVLADIAHHRPNSMAQLRRIKGMGPIKIDQYGQDLLAIVAANHDRR